MDIPPGSGEYIRIAAVGMGSGFYYSDEPAQPDDLELPLATFIVQHLSFRSVILPLYSLIDDIHLLSASIDKLEILRVAQHGKDSLRFSFLVESEIEHLFILLRSMYDLLQKMIKQITRLLSTSDGKLVTNELKESFASIILKKEIPRSCDEIKIDFKFPPTLANFYFSERDKFIRIRKIRNDLAHTGKRLPSVFVTEQGFGISAKGSDAWSALDIWKQHAMLPNDIGSVRALSGFLVGSFLSTLDNFEQALRSTIHPTMLPTAVSEGKRIYLRNPATSYLKNVAALIEQPWVS